MILQTQGFQVKQLDINIYHFVHTGGKSVMMDP